MSLSMLPNDPLWPRATAWLKPAAEPSELAGSAVSADSASLASLAASIRSASLPSRAHTSDLALIGIPAFRSSVSPTGAHATPAAVREALARYSTYAAGRGVDIARLNAIDLGDIEDPDGSEGESRVREAAAKAARACQLLIALGGDNSITSSVMRGMAGDSLAGWGLITVDAHHDLRDGISNGSPVRRLLQAGLPGEHVVQIGIADFANSAAYATRAREHKITIMHRGELPGRPMAEVAEEALSIAGANGRPVYVDLDVDVCDRSVAPGCPASAPGGISADELRDLAFFFGRDGRVKALDITEVDATADAPDGRTVRLAALLVLEAAAGLALRE